MLNLFSDSVGYLFSLLTRSFDTKSSEFWWVPDNLFYFYCLCFWCHFQEILAKSNVMKIFPYAFFRVLYFSSHIYVLDPLWVNFFEHGTRFRVRLILLLWISSFCVKMTILFPLSLGILVKDYLIIYKKLYFLALFYSTGIHTKSYANTHCLIYYSFIIRFEIRKCETSKFVLSEDYLLFSWDSM